MPTLTTAASGNDSAGATWVGGVAPVAGDDIIVLGHTLTLDRDITYNSITFNNASSRLAIGGATRSVQATNGFILGVNLSAVLITTAIPIGTSLTLTGTWSGSGALVGIANSTGGNLTLATIGNDPGSVLFSNPAVIASSRIITGSWSAGTLTTIGRFDMPTWTGTSTLVTLSGGTWNHTNSGTSLLGPAAHFVLNNSASATVNWTGDLVSASTSASLFAVNGSLSVFNVLAGSVIKRTSSIGGANHQSGTWSSVLVMQGAASGAIVNIDGVFCSSKSSRAIAMNLAGGRVNWRNQTKSLPSTDAVVIIASALATVDLTDLVLNNAGVFTYVESGSATTVESAGTLITNTSTSAQASVFTYSGALDGKMLNLAADAPTLPAVEEVAGGVEYGYDVTPLTGTGLVVDPALFAAAVGTALENISAVALRRFVTIDTGETEATAGSVASFGGGGGGETKEDIYVYFTTGNRQDTFKATGFAICAGLVF